VNIETFVQSELVAHLGWTLVASSWQIGLISISLFVFLRVARDASPNFRYLVAVLAFVLAVALPVWTFVQISTTQRSTSASNRLTGYERVAADTEIGSSRAHGQFEHNRSADAVSNASASGVAVDIVRWWNRIAPDVLPAAVLAWMLGVMLLSLRLIGGFAQVRRYRTRTAPIEESGAMIMFSRLCESLGLTRHVALLRSEFVRTPIAIGILKPAIILPASLLLQINPRELETIVAHELIHIRRYDPLVNLAQCVVETFLFFHPGIWWISAQIRREREFAADAAVMELFEDSHVTYARALANLEEIRLRTNQNPPRYVTPANGGNFMQRIQRILKIKTEMSSANSAWTAGLAFVLTSAFLLTLFSFSSSELVNAQSKTGSRKLAIGFVSIPPVDRTANAPKDSDATARMLIDKLKMHKVPAIGFLQGGMISDGENLFPVRANIARMWIDAGFEVGLGGFKHIGLYHTPVDEYIANIEKNERVAKRLIGDMGNPPRYFSYPYLNTGRSAADRAKVEAWLASRGYTPVKYTFDNQEWMYSYAYDMARNDNDVNTMNEIRTAYLDYIGKMFDHYEAYSQEMFGRDIAQTMVLTPSRLITDTADEFFAMTAKRGYTFITVDEAQKDPAYRTPEDFYGKAGISWFERWSMAKGKTLRDEPPIDDLVQKIWNEREKTAKK
jgi:beta-lactamase regulating signal transducer with metallopeptidase domain/peptidoglycan/xylan/chitin deacetylase (PgdA/CDA1 family)